MIVRCGRCQAELEVPQPGEFVCPACGTRNAVRAPAGAGPADSPFAAPADPFGLPNLGTTPAPPPADLIWLRCSECRRRFVVGEGVEIAPCPACGHEITVAEAERA